MKIESPERGRALTALVGLLVIPLFVGVLLSPFIYMQLRRFVIRSDDFVPDDLASFEKVTARVVKILAVILIIPFIRYSGLGPAIRRALTFDAVQRRDLGRACFVGCVSMASFYILGLAFGVYQPEDYVTSWGLSLWTFASFLVGSIFIGVFEETFFRGFVFGALRTRARFWYAAFAASIFFAFIHFVSPDFPAKIKRPDWDQGLQLLPYLFSGFAWDKDWPFFCTLFIMGLTLCVIYERRGHLAWCIGLHGGWVLAMRLGNYFLGRDREFLEWWFSRSDYIAKGPAAIPLIFIFFLWALMLKPKPQIAVANQAELT